MTLFWTLPLPEKLPRADEREILHVRAQRVGRERRLYEISARVEGFSYRVASIVDDVGVVAGAADQCIGAGAAIQRVVAGAAVERVAADAAVEGVVLGSAGDDVVERVAGAGECCRAGIDQVLEVGTKRVGGGRRLHSISAGADAFGDHIADVVDDVGVVACAADEGVGTRAAVQRVIGASAGDDVAQSVAGAREGASADERQVLEVVRECEGRERRFDSIGAGIGRFRNDVAGIVDDVGVVAAATDELVGSCPAVERIGANAARDGVGERVARAAERACASVGEVLDLCAERVSGRCRFDGVGAA